MKGPFASWRHRHGIRAEAQDGVNGTLISDDIEYEMPLGPLGALGNMLFVRAQMDATFAYRQQRLLQILPVAARQAAKTE